MSTAIVIPICCACNSVREFVQAEGMEESWGPLDTFLSLHHLSSGEYHLTHTYCPRCAVRFSTQSHADPSIARPDLPRHSSDGDSHAATMILDVFSRVQRCDLDMLVRACPTLTWNQVFSEVDRLSRIGQLRLKYLGRGQYSIELPESSEMPLMAQT